MPSILHDFPIAVSAEKVFEAVSTPRGLDEWWTKRSKGTAGLGETFELWFGPGYDWRAKVIACVPGRRFELEMTTAMDDWMRSRVGFELSPKEGATQVRFWHSGWAEESDHFKTSSYCWAMYLRILKRYLEKGERVTYEERLEV